MLRFRLASARALVAVLWPVAALMFASPSLAAPTWMTEQDIASAFSGVTIDGEYADGRRFTERYNKDKSLNYQEGPMEIDGYWSVTAGTFCTIYADDATGGCYRVTRVGQNCYEFYFVTRTEEEAASRPSDKPSWTARGWHQGEPASCREGASV
ncbi:MAG: hypothetical protein NW205_02620 [Hyphomicrobiaceae bacterium]|nr:hypothetical protein [Hyphomicrobiaceae bacterium]